MNHLATPPIILGSPSILELHFESRNPVIEFWVVCFFVLCHTGSFHFSKGVEYFFPCLLINYLSKSSVMSPLCPSSPRDFPGAKEPHRGGTSDPARPFTKCQSGRPPTASSSHRTTIKFLTHSFFSSPPFSFFVRREDASLESPLRLLFKGPCVAG